MLTDFTINIHTARKPLAVQVKVHDSTAALRMACKKRDNRIGGEGDFSDTLGICHRFHMWNDPLSAIVRLAPPYITHEIVAHEMAHAAVHLWDIQTGWDIPLDCSNDEWFCTILGELVGQTTTVLQRKNLL